jgi:tetratricopeptide (TPR) repeat protein
VARARQDHPAALSHFRQALAIYRQIDAKAEIARCLAGIGWVALTQHDLDLARTSLTESLRLSLATGQRLAIARGLEAFAMLGVAEGRPARAARLEGAALALREAVGHVPSSPARARLGDLLESARRAVGSAAAEALLAAGAAMSADEAVALATGSRAGGDPELGDSELGDSVLGDSVPARDSRADRARPVQPRHRRRADYQPGDRGPPCSEHPRQARF